MAFIIENLRLKELAAVTEQNRPAYEDLVLFLRTSGFHSLHAFIAEANSEVGEAVLLEYLKRPLPVGVELYDGIARPYAPGKAKWLLLGWILRDAPEQRLKPMVASMPRSTVLEKQAFLLNQLRMAVAEVFSDPNKWEWIAISEVVVDRLEGSRRSIKGMNRTGNIGEPVC